MQQIMIIAGTRPEAIKLAPVFRVLQSVEGMTAVLLSTGQHGEMLQQAWQSFGITPDIDAHVMTQAQSLAGLSSRLFTLIDNELEKNRPDFVLAQGDTTTVLVSAMCSFYRKIPFGHVEAGLRSRNMYSPFPEEFNRRVAGLTASLHFAPTSGAADNLRREGVEEQSICVTGNTIVDALHYMRDRVRVSPPELPQNVREAIGAGRPIVLITLHRRELPSEGLKAVCNTVAELARQFPQAVFIWPVHLSPRINSVVHLRLSGRENLFLIQPLDYASFIYLLDKCHFVISDSGGIQEEAPSFGKRVLVLREETERPEAVTAGFCKLLGTNVKALYTEASQMLSSSTLLVPHAANPFGDGHAAERIVQCIEDFFIKHA